MLGAWLRPGRWSIRLYPTAKVNNDAPRGRLRSYAAEKCCLEKLEKAVHVNETNLL